MPEIRFEPKSWTLKFVTTLSLCGTVFALGICTAIHGATLLQLRYVTQLSMTDISYIFPAFALGSLIGTLPAGLLPARYDGRKRYNLAFLVGLLGAAMMAAIPYSDQLGWLLTAFLFFGFTYAYYDTDLTTLVTDIWGDDGAVYLSALRSSPSAGVFVGGFLCVPFVHTVPDDNTSLPLNTTHVTPTMTSSDDFSKLRDIYLIGMGFIIMTSLFMIIMLMTSRKQVKAEEYQRLYTAVRGSSEHDELYQEMEKRSQRLNIRDYVTIIFLAITIATTMATTAAFCNFLVTFTVVFLHLTPEEGAVLLSVYGCCTVISNIIATLAVRLYRPSRLIAMAFSATILGFLVIIIHTEGSVVIWITTILFGLGNIATMILTYITAEQFAYLTKGVAGIFAASTGLAALLSMLLISSLFDTNPMVVMYFCPVCAVLGSVSYLSAMFVNRRQLASRQ